MAVAAAMPGQVNQEGDPQHNPFIAHDAPREDKEIRQGRPWQENAAQQRPDPRRDGKGARQGPVLESEIEELRIRQPPEKNGDPWNEHEKNGADTRHGAPLIEVLSLE